MAILHIEQPNTPAGAPSSYMNLILIVLAVVSDWAQNSTAEVLYIWTWRGLSLISLILLIYLNLHKVIDTHKGKKQSKDGSQ